MQKNFSGTGFLNLQDLRSLIVQFNRPQGNNLIMTIGRLLHTLYHNSLSTPTRKGVKTLLLLWLIIFHLKIATAQVVVPFFTEKTLAIESFKIANSPYKLRQNIPLFSYQLNGKNYTTEQISFEQSSQDFKYTLPQNLEINQTLQNSDNQQYYKAVLIFKNIGKDTVLLSNIVPFGTSSSHVYITGLGDHWLSRAHLFRPNYAPVNVILPDNAWELGFSAVATTTPSEAGVCALMRRVKWDGGSIRKRFETIIPPNGTVTYQLWIETYAGDWHEGLRKMFQERYLYDLEKFDNTLFERPDLQWIKHTYTICLMMAWDKRYQPHAPSHTFPFQNKTIGNWGAFGLWPTWPTLGLDARNQFDLFKDLPGGLPTIRVRAQTMRAQGTKFFVCYNPWDESTRDANNPQSHLKGLAELIKETSADGVVLDTRGSSSRELQAAADTVRKGVVMYSEGMAVPKDMPNIVAGRVHNALYYPPMLNLNKFIKPDFAIFRVAEQYKEPIRREFATSFFNGYGTELNLFQAGTPDWVDEDYEFLAKTTRILRENSSVFLSKNYTPLIPTLRDDIFVNRWQSGDKTLYTIFSLIPEGFSGPLFEVTPREGYHFIDLWNHRELTPILQAGKWYIPFETETFHKKYLGTNNEGAVGCIAQIKTQFRLGEDFRCMGEFLPTYSVNIWKDNPNYEKKPYIADYECTITDLKELYTYEGKIITQVLDKTTHELIDESVLEMTAGSVRKIVKLTKFLPPPKKANLHNLIKIPAGKYSHHTTHGDVFLPYPPADTITYEIESFLIDKYLVSNADFKKFLTATRYKPKDATNFLKHWQNGQIRKGEENKPVGYVSWEDAKAYARWAGKSLPTEHQWQYAAEQDSLKKTTESIKDLQGVVWQLTDDLYQTGHYQYIMLKGGSNFKPTSSWWYVQGGKQPLTHQQILLRVSEGFERNATVGFRCVVSKHDLQYKSDY